jgi:hypothetical protein
MNEDEVTPSVIIYQEHCASLLISLQWKDVDNELEDHGSVNVSLNT